MLKKINNYINVGLLMSILFVILGVILVINPEMSLKTISIVIASLLIVNGITLFTFDIKYGNLLFESNFLLSILSIILGIILIRYPNILNTIIPILVGMWVICNGLFEFKLSLMISDSAYSLLSLTLSFISIMCGVILIINPISSAITITSLVGIVLIVYSISNFIDMVIFKINI